LKQQPPATPAPTWSEAHERFRHPAFHSIQGALVALGCQHWPTLDALNALAHGKRNFRNLPVRFVAPDGGNVAAGHYELCIATQGLIATRQTWHDLFNATVWLTFPRAKAAISEMHSRILEQRGDAELKARSKDRDVLTLFDEGGAVIVSEDAQLLELVKGFGWKELFWRQRTAVAGQMRVYLFGHSLFEKMLAPFMGITAKALCMEVSSGWLQQKHDAQITELDGRLAVYFLDQRNLASTRMLSPFPVLGLPGWHPQADNESFYDDQSYFRPGNMQER
jgi:Protein of unknown function (DUF3025)